jgi:phosphotransacetylase
MREELSLDGPLQYDAASMADVVAAKAPAVPPCLCVRI